MIKNKVSYIFGGNLVNISQVSRDTGITRNTLMNIYYRKSNGIQFDTLDKLCKYFDCSIGDLFEYEKESEGVVNMDDELYKLEEKTVHATEKQKTVAKKVISALEGEDLSLQESFEILDIAKYLISSIQIF